ncbi:MutS-related protein [Microscilla marina]|uniref:DNA mismatch repair protein MutS n=1 Tax=Microscilla marina ATCC 23134 TaxID=313606 RepID=A1ZV05_MICM2|nr:DNA mismatch repair protein MutS [Microscilla marina]EAY25783.1 DNA mismatch repair protein MutS [Microscilla marina ATCC 23134]
MSVHSNLSAERQVFETRIEQFQELAQQFQTKYNRISTIRLLVFLGAIIGAYYTYQFAQHWAAGLGAFVVGMGIFIALIKQHNRIVYQRNHYRFLQKINEAEIQRLSNELKGFAEGDQYMTPGHFYDSDLDIFGKHSIFQLLNRTTTQLGEKTLAQWLLAPARTQEIRQRQQAIEELKNNIEWRQDFEAKGKHGQEDGRAVNQLFAWGSEPAKVLPKKWLITMTYIMPIVSLAAFAAVLLGFTTYHILFIPIFINGFLLGGSFKDIQNIHEKTSKSSTTLKSYTQLLKNIEEANFNSEKLQKIKGLTASAEGTASEKISKLASILASLDQRQNLLFIFVANFFFLWDVVWTARLEKWRQTTRREIVGWLKAINQMEALNSIAGYAYANPAHQMPTISDKDYIIDTINLGHPLINAKERITNTMKLEGLGNSMVITGSNMSGKTTFERTVGVNIVLALAGAPVCADRMTVSTMQVFTSMRTQDSLKEHISSFYAELKRLKQLIDHLETNPRLPVIYLLDEILKGTNSQDRHLGAKALVFQLHGHRSTGLVSTHDLELGILEEQTNFIQNYSFNSQINGDQILFDYKLTPGICRSFNASKLMQNMGIEIDKVSALK